MTADDRSGKGPPTMTSRALPFESRRRIAIGIRKAAPAVRLGHLMHETHAISLRFTLAFGTPRSTENPSAQHFEFVTRLTSKTIVGFAAFVDR